MSEVPQYASKADVRSDWPARCARSFALDQAGAHSMDDLLAFRRPPKWESDRALLRRMTRLAQLREGSA
jgi:hypothetical protein